MRGFGAAAPQVTALQERSRVQAARLLAQRKVSEAQLATAAKTNWSRWAPLAIFFGGAVLVTVALAIRRKGRSR